MKTTKRVINDIINQIAKNFAITTSLIIIGFGIAAIMIFISGYNPLRAYGALLYGAFGTRGGFANTLVRTTPLLFTGLGILIAFRCSVYNIGGEGQLYMGALGSVLVGLNFPWMPAVLHVTLALVVAFIFGGIWGAIPGALKARLGVNEVITTLMMNFIAIWFIYYMVHTPLRSADSYNPVTDSILPSAALPQLLKNTELHAGILIALVIALLLHFGIKHTVLGFCIQAVGLNPVAAKHGGINVSKTIISVMFISGGLCGLAGAGEVLGLRYYLPDNISLGYGYIAIAVALLARLNALWVILSALFFGGIINGASYMQHATGISITLVKIIEGAVIVCISLFPVASNAFGGYRKRQQI